MKDKNVFALLILVLMSTSPCYALCVSSDTTASEGRKQFNAIRQARINNRITRLQYLKENYRLDRDYFCAPQPILELDLFNIMNARNVELGRMTEEEYDYQSDKMAAETARKLTGSN